MRLKRLVISGFKSFADKTILNFDAGITCIVGPNGCGKSNIADAFRWVLGEQSAKSMRGGKMPDVIFAGATTRKPLNVAEVSLTLSNLEGVLPIDYEEVTITRRLYRNGESEYLLNGNIVRLKDLQNLFLGSGIGKNAFSIFEQGKLDHIINYTPFERRGIFEEAAGILRFLERKREAMKRLDQADQNLNRAKDIHQEVEKQIVVLREQAEKAKKFKDNKELLEGLEKTSFVLRWNYLEKKWTDAELSIKKQESVLNEFKESLSQYQIKGQEIKSQLQQDEKTFRTKNEELFNIRHNKEMHIRENQTLQQRLQEAQQKEKKIKREIEELRLLQQTRHKTLSDIQQKQKKNEQEFTEAQQGLSSHHDRMKAKEKEVNQLREDLQTKQQKHVKNLHLESQVSSELKQLETRLENNIEKQKIIEQRQLKFVEESHQLDSLISEKKKNLNEISSLIDTYKGRLEDYEEKIKALAKEIEVKQKEIDLIQKKVLEQQARNRVLIRLRDDHEGFSSGSKKLLQESNNPSSIIYNKIRPLYEFLNPEPEMAEAVAIVLRTYAQTLVVEKQVDFVKVLEFAQQHKLQDYAIICAELIPKNITTTSFSKKVKINQISSHFLKSVNEVKNYQEALELLENKPNEEFWTQEGLFIDFKHVFFHVKPNENQVFLRENELRILEEELQKNEEYFTALKKQLEQLKQNKSKLQSDRSEVDQFLRKDEMKLVEINFGLQRSLADQEKIKKEQSLSKNDLEILLKQSEAQKIQVTQLQDKHFSIKQELSSLQFDTQELAKEFEKQTGTLRLLQQDQKDKNLYFQRLVENRQSFLHQLNVLDIQEQEFQKQEQHFLDELVDLEELQSSIKNHDPKYQQILEDFEKQLGEADSACQELDEKLNFLKENVEKTDQDIAKFQDSYRKAETDYTHTSLQLTQYHTTAKTLENELQERYQLTIQEAKLLPQSDKSLDSIEKQVRSLRHFINNADDINLASIEDLEKHEERHHFIISQLDDMNHSKEELLTIISQVDLESKKLFSQTFEIIRENFKKNFQILFNGGEADLQFTDNENILEAGIEIIAKPPGKQMRSITLMSGGEKCLTAVALMFAIFEFKPAPFCILDEIDAPLDDTNVERFTNVVKHFIDKCQFLIITHNKRTMAIGDVLFGVSMQEKGVSKLLSLEFSNEEIPEASLV